MSSNPIDVLMRRSIRASDVRAAGNYTLPRTFGVYQLTAAKGMGREFRFGNHPVRERELVRDYGRVQRQALFIQREDAKALAALLNLA